MPYIKAEDRVKYENLIENTVGILRELPMEVLVGELNFFISSIVQRLVVAKGNKYFTYNSLIGCMFCALLEMYRTDAAIYEDVKRCENGHIKKERL